MQLINKWTFFGLGIQSLTLSFPFGQGLSVSRRNFFFGTVGLFTVLAAAISALYMVLGVFEKATNGWGLQGQMFGLAGVADRPWAIQWFFYFILMMFLFLRLAPLPSSPCSAGGRPSGHGSSP